MAEAVATRLPRLGSALLVRSGDAILLGRRAKDPQRGRWVIPGGRVEPFESLSEAGIREIREETGLDVAVGDRLGVFEIIIPPAEHRVIVYSWATIEDGIPQPGSDLDELRFFTRDELETADLTPAVREVLRVAGWLDQGIFVSA